MSQYDTEKIYHIEHRVRYCNLCAWNRKCPLKRKREIAAFFLFPFYLNSLVTLTYPLCSTIPTESFYHLSQNEIRNIPHPAQINDEG